MTTGEITKAAEDAWAARLVLQQAIRDARAEGMPLRAIAKAAGMSHEQVRRLTR